MEDWERELEEETKMAKKKKAPAKIKVVKAPKRKKTVKTKPKAKPKKKLATPRNRGKQKPSNTGTILMNYRVRPTLAKEHRAKANRLTNGNVTQMIIAAVKDWKPNPKKLKAFRATTYA